MAAPPDDPDPDSGMFWLNLIGLAAVLGLLTTFMILYGKQLAEFVDVLLGANGAAGPMINGVRP